MKHTAWLLCGAAIVIVITALGWPTSIQAQSGDPWGNLATVEAQATRGALDACSNTGNAQGQAAQAEAQAQQAAAAARQAEAQAAAAQAHAAQQAAAATRQAADYANAQAHAQATANAAMQATRAANEARATGQAINATAAAIQQAQAAQATRDALDAQATRSAYEIAFAETRRRSDFGAFLLYLAGALAMAATTGFVIAWARRMLKPMVVIERLPRGSAPGVNESVVDAPFTPIHDGLPALPMPGSRGFNVRVIDNAELVNKVREYLYRYGVGAEDDDGNDDD